MPRSVLVKTLTGGSFRIAVAEDALMGDVKTKISQDRGIDPASQVLICAGKTLKNDDTLADSVDPSGFLVLMVKAARRATPVVTASSSSSSSSSSSPPPPAAPASTPAPAPVPAGASPPAPPAAATAVAGAARTAAPANANAALGAGGGVGGGGAAEELAIDPASVEMLTAMGFPEDQARPALRAAFNDVTRAASYLMEGIPDEAMGAAAGGAPGGQAEDDAAMAREGGAVLSALAAGIGEGEGNPLNFMRFHPQFEQIRSLVRENPAVLPQVLQQLGNQSPELMERISAHPDHFLQLMNDPPDAEGQAMMEMGIEGLMEGMEQEDDEQEVALAGEAAVGVGGGGAGEGVSQGQQVTVELTEEENEAVQNLMAMVPGVGRDEVLEAFIACDKNAEMAANLLFENAL